MKIKLKNNFISFLKRGFSTLTLCFFISSTSLVASDAPGGDMGAGAPAGGAPAGQGGGAGQGEFSAESREYHLKAAFLRYVAKFVEWPANAIPVDKINICILGQIPNFKAINSINGKVVNDRTITINKVLEANDAKGACQILFVTKTEDDKVTTIVKTVTGLPILSFGDMENFALKGGNMNFYIANNRLGIMINPPSVDKANLKIDPRMLKIVTVVPNVDNAAKPVAN